MGDPPSRFISKTLVDVTIVPILCGLASLLSSQQFDQGPPKIEPLSEEGYELS